MLLLLLLSGVLFAGCADDGRPVLSGFLLAESPSSVLAYTVAFDTDLPATTVVEVVADDGEVLTVPADAAMATTHELTILGLRAETTYTLVVRATGPGGGEARREEAFTTRALPDDLPPLDVEVLEPDRVEPGYTFFGIRRWTPAVDGEYGYLLALNRDGDVVWYVDLGHVPGPVEQRPNGNIVYTYQNRNMAELTPLGDRVWSRAAGDLGMDSFHHENHLLADGSILVLGTELRTVGGYPDDATYDVVGDTVALLDPGATTVLHEHSLFDVLDPLRTRPGFDATFWNGHYADVSDGTKDWTHGNAVVVDPSDGSYVASLRHQDWLVKVAADDGSLLWRFGHEGDFALTDNGLFPFHTHSPVFDDDGVLLVYDNGNARVGLEGPPFTRAVAYRLDEAQMTATELWEYRGDEPYHAPFVGSVQRLTNGNVLVTDGGLIEGCPSADDPMACVPQNTRQKWARVTEVTGDADATAVWRLTVRDDAEESPTGYTVYRAYRIASLYGAQ